ncbi:MAG: hypothetical protein CSB06_02445 [Bacteroidia bacterium]|nr:MAG: hypothetical protein CSB06_02445 [Bacteroidia bacterium]
MRKRLLDILFWSVLSAAFIGPGTVTTATKAGVFYNFDLLWALVFSTFATLLLQEAGARLAIRSHMNLGEAIAQRFARHPARKGVLLLVITAIVLGCAAYEAGNILGAVAGLTMIFNIPAFYFVAGIGLFAGLVFFLDSVHTIARVMGILVFFMGAAFFFTSLSLKPDWSAVLRGSLIPQLPSNRGGALLVLGLIGTTVIPYDLFLGSGVLSKKQSIKDMRFGLSAAIILGGIISMSIMGVGNAVSQGMTPEQRAGISFDYTLLTQTLENSLGIYAVYVFGFGMFAAGFSSAVTAPLASAITAGSLFSNEKNKKKWASNQLYFKLVIAGVLGVGLLFGFLQVKPIPAIIITQAFNGMILPFIAIFLIYVINDENIMGKEHVNGWLSNILMALVLWITLLLGFTSILKSAGQVIGFDPADSKAILLLAVSGVSFLIVFFVLTDIFRRRRKMSKK